MAEAVDPVKELIKGTREDMFALLRTHPQYNLWSVRNDIVEALKNVTEADFQASAEAEAAPVASKK